MQPQNKPRQVPILMYHSISNQVQPRFRKYAVLPARFAEHLAYLHQQQYTTFTVSEYARALTTGARLPQRVVVLTFDDGLADFYDEAFPLLKQYGFVATLYIPTAFVGETSRFLWRETEADRLMLSWVQLRELCASGIECGAHSHRHLQLDVIPLAVARDEIIRSKQILEEKLSREVTSFAYPYGYYRSTVKQLVRAAGYTSACAVRYHMSSAADDVFALSRLFVPANIPIERFARLLAGRGPQLTPAYERTRAWVWRAVRTGLRVLTPKRIHGNYHESSYA